MKKNAFSGEFKLVEVKVIEMFAEVVKLDSVPSKDSLVTLLPPIKNV